MKPDWRNEPATEEQQEKLRFFGCTWNGGITVGRPTMHLRNVLNNFLT